jgi:hypothetical protein
MTLQTAESRDLSNTMSSLLAGAYQQGSEVRFWPSREALPKAPANDRSKTMVVRADQPKKRRILRYAAQFAAVGLFLTVTAAALPIWMIYSFIWLSQL